MENRERQDVHSIVDDAFSLMHTFVVLSIVVFVGWNIFSVVQGFNAMSAAPWIKATASITSKDNDQRLSVKSTDLPKGGDVVNVDQYAYGALAPGDTVCLQYKRIPDDSQYGIELVGKGACK
jgi:hypothetical protein